MKAITLHQPWATLVAIGAKKIETRSWSTTYRGPLAIHAGRNKKYVNAQSKDYLCDEQPFFSVLAKWMTSRKSTDIPLGYVVATCNLVEVVRINLTISFPACKSYWHNKKEWLLHAQERAFGDYSVGRYMWLLDDVQVLPEPIPAKGSMGFWEWDCASSI